ncbi:MAG: right-handed parallel beta-helix repeat-containing protein [Planctomycetota bacterium]|nr:right-handed parallel beta-helix repeat-containing protein [Planctomycetota bacterium]
MICRGPNARIRRFPAGSIALLVVFATGCTSRPGPAVKGSDIGITASERITRDRTYSWRNLCVSNATEEGALVIETDNVVLDLGGAEMWGGQSKTRPDEFVGRGIVVRNARNVTIKNGVIRGFKVGIYAENAPGLTIEHCDVSNNYRQRLESTPDRENLEDWLYGHENDDNQWLRYGAGIYLLRCDDARILCNRARNGQNGICVVDSDGALVRQNDMSYMSGWGLALWRSNFCRVLGNSFDYCVRGYSHGIYARGQDSTGILVYEQCSDNLFAFNSATHGGDGFFLYAGNETVKKTGEGGCNRNIVFRNDFSYAVANGIEATFSNQNAFIANTLVGCRHGIWAGYSRNSVISWNTFSYCDNGVSIEHGEHNRIANNHFGQCGLGVNLWWDDDVDLLASPFGRRHGGRSDSEVIESNRFDEFRTAIRAASSTNLSIHNNTFEDCDSFLVAEGSTTLGEYKNNVLNGATAANRTGHRLIDAPATGQVDLQADGDVNRGEPPGAGRQPPSCYECRICMEYSAVRATGLPASRFDFEFDACRKPQCAGYRDRRPLGQRRGGLETIFVDDWGPYDRNSPARCYPEHVNAWTNVSVLVLGDDVPYRARVVEGNVRVSPPTGRAPAVIKIARGPEGEIAGHFRVRVGIGSEVAEVHGMLLGADWKVRYFEWTQETDPRSGADAWTKVTSAPPICTEQADGIDFVWGGRGPGEGLPGDYFAAVATTRMQLPVGRWVFKTVSDDGVRVYFDGERIIDHWTWHGPTEDTAEVDVGEGDHDIRIEYFEIDGHAQLQFFIEPVPPNAGSTRSARESD